MTARLHFTEASIRRAISAAQKAGLPVTATTVHPDGAVTIYHQEVAPQTVPEQDAEAARWADVTE